jgi:primosomal protein N' (replication factor Y)
MGEVLKEYIKDNQLTTQIIGPAPASIAKAKDVHRRVIYIKDRDYNLLVGVKNYLEGYFNYSEYFIGCNLQFDFNPISIY